jgi:hypothetical protein
MLGFDHPVSGKHMWFESELPSALAQLKRDIKTKFIFYENNA